MSIFGKQLQDRIRQDSRMLNNNLRALGKAAGGKDAPSYVGEISSQRNIRQVEQILLFMKITVPEIILETEDLEEQIDQVIQSTGIMKRSISLDDQWWKDGYGPMLAVVKKTGTLQAIFPKLFHGLYYLDPDTGKKISITEKNKDLFETDAWCLYKPLPQKEMSGKDYILFLIQQFPKGDLLVMFLAILFTTLFGTLTPVTTTYAFSYLVPSGKVPMLIPLGIMLAAAAFGTWLLNVVKTSVSNRISTHLDVISENAVYSRVLNLPATFFGGKSAGGIAHRVSALNAIPVMICDILFGCILPVLLSVIYIIELLSIAQLLVFPVFIIYIVEIILLVITMVQERKMVRMQLAGGEKNSGLVYAFISGIQKIKISGSEKRALAKWMESYSDKIRPSYMIRFPVTMRMPLVTAVHLLGTLWIFSIAYENQMSVAEFAGFSAAFGLVMGGINSLANSGTSISSVSPILESGAPILQCAPEARDRKKAIQSLKGKIELNQVSFQYDEESPMILKDLNLTISPGEYVAIVGPSGCGKSTLLRILLGFETPQQGAVFYDDTDMEAIDKRSLRQHIGTVLQNGKLFTGDIYSNITISAPWLGMDDAWEAAEKAGVAEDIKRMPMGMHTFITEGIGGISGGQKQRILIARAMCSKPNVMMFDEATSALDNLTQKIVTESMNQMNCTRIIIAHRLSTIRECDRILVLNQGKIQEDGTYDELMAKNGLFKQLAARQLEDWN